MERNNYLSKVWSILMTFILVVIGLPGLPIETKAAINLNNPRIVADESMQSGQKVTYDCVWFGNYPQTEIVGQATQCGTYGRNWGSSSDYIVDNSLYSTLNNASGWNNEGDITLPSGIKYHRMKMSDANFDFASWYEAFGDYDEYKNRYYNWRELDTYHYFRYEPVKWRVLSVSDNKALLLADKCLDAQKYNPTDDKVTWEKSTIRSWLNGYSASTNTAGVDYSKSNFINRIFSASEKEAVLPTSLDNETTGAFSNSNGGENTLDKIYLLAAYDLYNSKNSYNYGFYYNGGYDEARLRLSSTYSKAMGLFYDDSTTSIYCNWFLRSPGRGNSISDVNLYGSLGDSHAANDAQGICPALTVNITSNNPFTYAGTVCTDGSVDEQGNGNDVQYTYNVYYDANGGSGAPASQSKVIGKDLILSKSYPTRSGYTFAGWGTSKNTTVVTYKPGDIYRDDSNITLYAVWKQDNNDNETNLDKLTYGFSNSASAFGYSTSYRIPIGRYKMFFSDTLSKYLYRNAGEWGGSCYGMAATSGMFRTQGSGINIGNFKPGAIKLSELKTTDKSNELGLTIRELIEAMFVTQYDGSIQRTYNQYTNLNSLCNEVKKVETGGSPVLIAVFGPQGGHALLGYKIEKIDSAKSLLHVYDCNYPAIDRAITLTTNGNGSYTGWYYHLNGTYNWGSNYSGCSIAYTPYSIYQNMWTKKKSSYTSNMICVNSDNFEVRDYDNNLLAVMSDGNFSSNKNDIYEYQSCNIGSNTNMLYLPTDVYQIINTDIQDTEFEVSTANVEQSLTVTTAADNVLVAVDDSDGINTVSVDADEGESYNVVLNSSLPQAKDMEEIEYSGIGNGTTITVGMEKGNCIISNCTGISMWINGEMAGSTSQDYQTNIGAFNATIEYSSVYYDGKNKEPDITLKNGVSTLKKGIDYVVIYDNNINPGTATATIYGIGSYTGKIKKEFIIIKKPTPVSKIKITGISEQISAGRKIQLIAKVTPVSATNKKLKWTSSNTKIATVSQRGLVVVKPNTGGKTVVIKAEATDGSGVKATWKIKSMKGIVKSIKISGKKKVKAGKKLKLKAKVKATKGANKKVMWTSSNKKYATVSGSGVVKALPAGKGKKVKITAMATDGSGKKKAIIIKIK